jgi:hypothetical protein
MFTSTHWKVYDPTEILFYPVCLPNPGNKDTYIKEDFKMIY